MPRLTEPVLYTRLEAALPTGSTIQSAANLIRPLLATVPGIVQFRIYLWTLTRDRSQSGSRPRDEFKIQFILPGQQSGYLFSATFGVRCSRAAADMVGSRYGRARVSRLSGTLQVGRRTLGPSRRVDPAAGQGHARWQSLGGPVPQRPARDRSRLFY